MTTEGKLNTAAEEIARLRLQLEEANDTIEAIRSGQVDALILRDESGHRLYTLKSADHTYRIFIENMREGAVTLNEEGVILYSNSAFANMVSFPLSRVIGRYFLDFITEADKPFYSSLFLKGWHTESKGEMCLQTGNNNELPVLASLHSIEIGEGTALGIILTNLSAIKETEKQLKQKNEDLVAAQGLLEKLNNELEKRVLERTSELFMSREHFKFLAENIPAIVWTATAEGTTDYSNNKFLSSSLHQGKNINDAWRMMLHPDDLPAASRAWKESLAAGKEYSFECRLLIPPATQYKWHSLTSLPFRDNTGKIVKWFGISTDIENQKQALSQKDEFISMASHELKTPVTILKAYVEVLALTLPGNENAQALEFTHKMDKQITRLSQLITDLLDATKSNAGILVFEKEQFLFEDLVTEITAHMRMTTNTHTIELNLSNTGFVYADRNRIGQVISNLIINAIKYSPAADKIVVSTEREEGYVILSVRDFGIGVPAEQQSQLFNRFFRSSAAKASTFPGLGLGLYISNEILKHHDGALYFESEEGKGSTFCMRLPAV